MASKEPVRVLVVDDDAAVRKVVSRLVAGEVQEVAEAKDGREAIEAALRFRPAVVLLDLSMPVMNGLEALAVLRERLPETRVLMLTGNQELELAEEAMELGALDYVMKPLDWGYLRSSLRAQLALAK